MRTMPVVTSSHPVLPSPFHRPALLALFTPVLLLCLAAAPATQPAVDYAIVVTGGEMLAGTYADAHTQFLARTLRPLGLHCVASITVDDRADDIHEALRFAKARAKLILITGGLGPTDNDITRETLAQFTGIPLREHPDVLREMETRFNTPRDRLRANLRRQSQTPTRGTYLKNSSGTAVGLVFELDDAVIVALPGPPRELQPMVREQLIGYLSKRFGTRPPGTSLTLRFVGIGQSQISQTIHDELKLPADITVSSDFQGMRVDFTFALPGDTPTERERLDELKRGIQKHLGDWIYADDDTSLEEHVARRLARRNWTLAIAEVGTDGDIAAGLCAAATADQVLAGAFVASTEQKLRRLLRVSDEPWNAPNADQHALLAHAAAELAGSSWAVAIGQIRQAPDGTRHVPVLFRMPAGNIETQRFPIRGSGELARAGVATQILDHMRRLIP